MMQKAKKVRSEEHFLLKFVPMIFMMGFFDTIDVSFQNELISSVF